MQGKNNLRNDTISIISVHADNREIKEVLQSQVFLMLSLLCILSCTSLRGDEFGVPLGHNAFMDSIIHHMFKQKLLDTTNEGNGWMINTRVLGTQESRFDSLMCIPTYAEGALYVIIWQMHSWIV